MLLAEYGLRAGEVVRLRLEDIDWRQECLRKRHSETGAETILPLMPSVGDALLDYLQQARPKTAAREVFVRLLAPRVPLRRGSSLYPLIQRLLAKAGVTLDGKRGPHTFRHARAVSLLGGDDTKVLKLSVSWNANGAKSSRRTKICVG